MEDFDLSEKIERRIKDNEWAICYDNKIRSSEFYRGEINGLKVALELNKEFIKLLKEELRAEGITEIYNKGLLERIDKLAGDKLKGDEK